jgi:hypothetical protein
LAFIASKMTGTNNSPGELRKRARYLLSIACLVKDAAKHDELQQKADYLLAEAAALRDNSLREGGTSG